MKFSSLTAIFIVAPWTVANVEGKLNRRKMKAASTNSPLSIKSCKSPKSTYAPIRRHRRRLFDFERQSGRQLCHTYGQPCCDESDCDCDFECNASTKTCSCVAGTTGVFRKNEDGEATVVEVASLRPGDLVRGLDEDRVLNDECVVLALDDWGSGEMYGNYTADHYNFDEKENLFAIHGHKGVETYGEKYSLITSCVAVQDESGIFFSPLDAYTVPSDQKSLDWEKYIKFYNLVAYFASSHHISSTEYVEDNGGNTLPTSSEFLSCLEDGKSCTAFGGKHIDAMTKDEILQLKSLLESKFGLAFPADSMEDLKSAHRILYQRRIRPMREPSQSHRLLK